MTVLVQGDGSNCTAQGPNTRLSEFDFASLKMIAIHLLPFDLKIGDSYCGAVRCLRFQKSIVTTHAQIEPFRLLSPDSKGSDKFKV